MPVAGHVERVRDPRNVLAENSRALDAAYWIDSAKIARVRAAIESGTYVVDAEAVASPLLDVEWALQRVPYAALFTVGASLRRA
jgi:anti-sigma28 factor (negative regulator of flagellin synthesis)